MFPVTSWLEQNWPIYQHNSRGIQKFHKETKYPHSKEFGQFLKVMCKPGTLCKNTLWESKFENCWSELSDASKREIGGLCKYEMCVQI